VQLQVPRLPPNEELARPVPPALGFRYWAATFVWIVFAACAACIMVVTTWRFIASDELGALPIALFVGSGSLASMFFKKDREIAREVNQHRMLHPALQRPESAERETVIVDLVREIAGLQDSTSILQQVRRLFSR